MSNHLSEEQWERLQQFSAFKEKKDEDYKPYLYVSIFVICYIVAQFIRVLF